jgi:hypothetical protein
MTGSFRKFNENKRQTVSANISPRYRVNDRLSFRYSLNWLDRRDDAGYVNKLEADSVVFGIRDFATVTNTLNSSYIFTSNMSLTLRARHYWSRAMYKDYAFLNEKGKMEVYGYDRKNHDVNFNAFNVDMVFSWWFAPGSEISLVWKNAVLTSEEAIISDYFRNFNQVIGSPQNNSISFKVLYFLDALMLKNKTKKGQNADPVI